MIKENGVFFWQNPNKKTPHILRRQRKVALSGADHLIEDPYLPQGKWLSYDFLSRIIFA